MRIIYLMSGPEHLPYLVASIHCLRYVAKYTGPVEVYGWPESMPILREIESDSDLAIKLVEREPTYRGKNSQFFDKIKLAQEISDTAIYLDADTMPVKTIWPLLYEADGGFVATQFCDWRSNTGLARKRVERLREHGLNATWIDASILMDLPSVNGGVFGFNPNVRNVLQQWEEWTNVVKEKVFIADEAVLHMVVTKYRGFDCKVLPGIWNCSPKFLHCDPDDVCIWHFHGDCNVRMKNGELKSQIGYDLWWPVFADCLDRNVGHMKDWIDQCGNKYISELRA